MYGEKSPKDNDKPYTVKLQFSNPEGIVLYMICRTCSHCGLCPGDGSDKEGLIVQTESMNADFVPCSGAFAGNAVGLAFDIGTTTVACRAYALSDGMLLCSFGEKNPQTAYGNDVITRISFSMKEGGFKKLNEAIVACVREMISRAMLVAQGILSEKRRGRAELKRITVAGNTVMESLFYGTSVSSLACHPFIPESKFGIEIDAEKIFGPEFFAGSCKVYIAPAAAAFIGGDMVCAMIASGFHRKSERTRFLADLGTNCEMCVSDPESGRIFCASAAAGPAFEGFGIDCGSSACKGAIAKFHLNDGKPEASVIGGGDGISISGTGLVSAVSSFLDGGILDVDGGFRDEKMERFYLSDKVWISRGDVRNFQLAKGAVCCGLKMLAQNGVSINDPVLYLAGGFGTQLDPVEAKNTRMIPDFFEDNVISIGNGALQGASMLLFDENLRRVAEKTAAGCIVIDLASDESFQSEYMDALGF